MEEHTKCVASLLEAQNFSFNKARSNQLSSKTNKTNSATTTLTIDTSEWKDKVTYHNLLLLQLCKKIQKEKARRLNRNTLFSPGAHVHIQQKDL